LVVITGPSGVGKSTIVREAIARTGADFSVSATTRKPRPGEVGGREYRFIDRSTFEGMIANDQLLEWAEVFGQYYGTPREPVEKALVAGRTVILEIDVAGGKQIHTKAKDAVFVLIEPPDKETLANRLAGRGSESAQERQDRLGQAEKEMTEAKRSGVYNHCVVNDDLAGAINQVVNIIHRETTKE